MPPRSKRFGACATAAASERGTEMTPDKRNQLDAGRRSLSARIIEQIASGEVTRPARLEKDLRTAGSLIDPRSRENKTEKA
jgi:hypothetical protein